MTIEDLMTTENLAGWLLNYDLEVQIINRDYESIYLAVIDDSPVNNLMARLPEIVELAAQDPTIVMTKERLGL